MKKIVTLVATLFAALSGFADVPQLINYQGRLLNGTNLVNGTVELELRIYDASGGGNLLYEDSNTVAVVDGLYSTLIGDNTTSGLLATALTNEQIWIETAVNGVALSPRERVSAAAYAMLADGVKAGGIASAMLADGAITSGKLAAGAVTGDKIVDGTITAAKVMSNTFWGATGNAGTTPGTHYLGTTDNQPLEVKVGGTRSLRIEPDSSSGAPNLIGGAPVNAAGTGVIGATIAGGGTTNYLGSGEAHPNLVHANYGAIGGGVQNSIQTNADSATIGGGAGNSIRNNSQYVTIGGGQNNSIDTDATHATVAGGMHNSMGWACTYSTIGGGKDNAIGDSAGFATVAGGWSNSIGTMAYYSTIGGGSENGIVNFAHYAYAAGHRAWAIHPGAFVWADSSDFEFLSTAANEFSVRAVGGTRIVSGIDGSGSVTSGVQLAAGSGSWTSLSDVNAKDNFRAVDGQEILEKIAALNVCEWNYKTQDASIRHLGPMAQDFRAAFGLGETPTGISNVDADGIALTAIKELAKQVGELKRQNAELRERLGALEQK